MNLKKMSLEELEQLSQADIAYYILKNSKKSKNTADLFKEVCNLLQINETAMMDMIGDFYTNLTTDKRFLLLESAEWDLKEAHSVKMVVEEDEEDQSEEDDEQLGDERDETEDEAIEVEEDVYEDSDDDLEDLEDLAIVTEEEMDE